MKHRWPSKRPRMPKVVVLLALATGLTAVNLLGAGVLFDPTAALLTDVPAVPDNTLRTAFWDTLNPVADSQVSLQQAAANFGSQTTMRVEARNAKHKRSFAAFDVSGIVPGNEVLKAELTLCATSVPGTNRTYDLHRVTTAWAEGSITWNNQPGVASTVSTSATAPPSPGCMTWPLLTTDVQSWVVGAANDGWRAKDSTEDNARKVSVFRTREDTTVPSEQPSLFVVFRPCQDITSPAAPTGLAATLGDSQVGLDWNDNAEPDLAGYNVYRSPTQGGPYTKTNAVLVSTSAYTDTGLSNGTAYYYVVTALDDCANETGDSNEASATPQAVPPSPPTNLVATPGNTQVALTWDGNGEPDLAGYNLYRSTTQGGPYGQINASLVTLSSYTDAGLTNGTTYYYVVTAENNSAQESGNSNEASATPADVPPAAPTGLAATSQNAQVTLDWNDNVEPDLAGYSVYRSTNQGGPYTKINPALVSPSAYTDTGLTNGTTYYYVVTAEDTAGGQSGNSNETSATPQAGPPAPPTGLVATAGDKQVSLDWNDNTEPDLAGYNIYRSTTTGGPYSKINGASVAASDYIDTGLTGGVTYYYVVAAENTSAQESGNSNEANATPYSILIAASDSWVTEKKPGQNHGSDTLIEVKSKNGQAARGFVQFDVSSIPAGSTINSATLNLCAVLVPNATRAYNVHRVTAGWAEGTITWNNQPPVAATATDSATTPAAPGCMTWTVTTDVQAWVDGTANNGWRVRDSVETANDTGRFRSREDGAVPAEQPRLKVVFNVP